MNIFFVVSGYLITHLLLQEFGSTGAILLKNFYVRRALRICPAFYAFVIIMAVASLAGLISIAPGDFLSALTYTMNCRGSASWYVGHLWSLSVEAQFYLVWPLVLVFLGHRRAVRVLVLLLITLPLIRAAVLQFIPTQENLASVVFREGFDALATGCLFACIGRWLDTRTRYLRFLQSPLVLMAPACVVLTQALGPRHVILSVSIGQAVKNVAIALCLEHCVRYPQDLAGRVLNSRVFVFFGVLSYSLYLWQQPFLNRMSDSFVTSFPQNVVISVLVAAASYYLIERPFLKLRKLFRRQALVPSSIGRSRRKRRPEMARGEGEMVSSTRLRVGVLTGPALCSRHGTGVQILRIFEEANVDFWHLYWLGTAGYESDHFASAFLDDLPRLKRLRGGRIVEMLENALGTAWWTGDRVNRRKLSRLLEAREWLCDVAYVSVANEREAQRAWSILDVMACPYVVHLMDLCHDDGIVPQAMPGYASLLGHAERVLVASEAMRDEVRKVRADGGDVAPIAKRLGRQAKPPGASAGPLRLVMLGSLGGADNPALGVLADAMPALRARWPGFECLYMGQHYDMLPKRLRTLVTYPGRVDLKTFEQLLPTAHLAFLPSPCRLDCYGRFSPVARLTDYFAAGLPVLYCIARGSVPEQSLTLLSPAAAARTDTPESLIAAVERFADPVQWREASRLLRTHAEKHFTIERLRDRVFGALAVKRRLLPRGQTCSGPNSLGVRRCQAEGD